MRTLLIAVLAGSLLGLSPSAAQAATSTVTVNGFDYPGGLAPLTESCTSGTPPQPTALYRKGGKRGTHAIGLSFGGATGYESGVQAKVATPRSLTSISFATYHPLGPDADTAADGHFAAYYDPSGNNFANGYYFAYRGLDSTVTGWGTWSNLAAANLSWSYWNGASTSTGAYTGTLKQLADSKGTNGSGAWVGFEFGCNGRDYYLDDFRITTGASTKIYDFEGIRTRAYLSTPPTHHSRRAVRDVTKVTLTQGQGHWLWGDALGYGDTVVAPAWLTGTASLYAKPYGASSFKKTRSGGYSDTTWATWVVRAKKNVKYQVRTSSSNQQEAAVSKTLSISVKRRIKARLADNVVRRGNTVKVTGQLFPGDRGVTVTLQRKAGAKWKAMGKAKSGARGKYTVRAKATQIGKSKLRMLVGNAKGNLGNRSPAMNLTVKKPPPRPAPEPQTPAQVENPVPTTHIPSDEIKARALIRQLMRGLLAPLAPSADSPVPPRGETRSVGPVVVEPAVSQTRG